MRGKKVLACALCALICLGLLPGAALAAPFDIASQMIVQKAGPFISENRSFDLSVKIQNNGTAVNITDDNIVQLGDSVSGVKIKGSAAVLAANAETTVIFSASLDSNIAERSALDYSFYLQFEDDSLLEIGFTFFWNKRSTGNDWSPDNNGQTDGEKPEETTGPDILVLSPIGQDGKAVPAPKGDAGQMVQLRVPVYNRAKSNSGDVASEIRISPVVSATLDSFPFEINAVDYSRNVKSLKPGETQELVYNLMLSKEVKSGVKEVKFICSYYSSKAKAYREASFSVFVTVIKGKKEDDGMAIDKDTITTTPKLIIEAYTLTPDNLQEGDDENRLYAGESFTLLMRIRNTSPEEAVKNIQLTLGNEGGTVLPANNGSNSLYISKIASGEIVERTVQLQSSPDSEPKTQMLNVKFEYESAKTLKSYNVTEVIALPISHRLRVRAEDPVMYGDAFMGETMYTNFRLLNMGKSSLYNCMVNVEGQGLRMEETYFGGTISGGQTMYAELGVIAQEPGEIDAMLVITFEDTYGQETRIEKPFTMQVIDPNAGMDMQFPPGMEDMEGYPGDMFGGDDMEGEGMSLWLIITLSGAGVAALVALLIILRRKRRKKELTEGL